MGKGDAQSVLAASFPARAGWLRLQTDVKPSNFDGIDQLKNVLKERA